jgi:DNA polymerase III delta prime subunit
MLYAGNSGIGKTVAAECLARELGVAVDEEELGGLLTVPSGRLTGDHVQDAMRKLRMRPFYGSGWRVLICNEADVMTQSASVIWLDALENLPDRVVIVFTSNAAETLPQRFRDRCETYQFEGRSEILCPAIQGLCRKIWEQELPGVPPNFGSKLGMPSLGGSDSMFASVRMAVMQLSHLIREAKEKLEVISV